MHPVISMHQHPTIYSNSGQNIQLWGWRISLHSVQIGLLWGFGLLAGCRHPHRHPHLLSLIGLLWGWRILTKIHDPDQIRLLWGWRISTKIHDPDQIRLLWGWRISLHSDLLSLIGLLWGWRISTKIHVPDQIRLLWGSCGAILQ